MWTSVVCQKNSRPGFVGAAGVQCTILNSGSNGEDNKFIHEEVDGGAKEFHQPRFVLHRQQAADTSQITDGGIKGHRGSESHHATRQ